MSKPSLGAGLCLLLVSLCVQGQRSGFAPQTTTAKTGPGGGHVFGQIAGTGPLGHVLSFTSQPYSPSTHTLQLEVSGTAPSTCTLTLDGSLDGKDWWNLSGQQSCTRSNAFSVMGKPFIFIRVNVSAYTPGDATTRVVIKYARGM